MNKSKVWASGLLLAVFVAGAIVGGAASAMADRESRGSREPRPSYTELLQENVGLSEEQRTSVEAILEGWRSAMHDLREELRDDERQRLQPIVQDTRSQIMEILDDTQRAAYREFNARRDSTRAARQANRHK